MLRRIVIGTIVFVALALYISGLWEEVNSPIIMGIFAFFFFFSFLPSFLSFWRTGQDDGYKDER